MKTHDELYNAIHERLNTLIPNRPLVRVVHDVQDGEFDKAIIKYEKPEPTLQEILLALGTNEWAIDGVGKLWKRGTGLVVEYDLTKPVKEQETSTLQAIYDLLYV